MRIDLSTACGALAALLVGVTLADPQIPTASAARDHFDAGAWEAAAEAYRDLLELEPADAESWYQMGLALRRLERFDEAVLALENAVQLGFQPLRSLPSLAVTQADAGRVDDAFATLEQAVDAGLPPAVLEENPAFELLRGDVRFAALLGRADARAHPCETDPRYRTLDFWIGDWDVRAGGKTVGRSRVTRRQRGCAVHESWTAASGATGESLSFFDPKTGQWEQHWVDENGGVVWYAGGQRDGGLFLVGEHIRADGTVTPARATLTPQGDGTLHHRVEHLGDTAGESGWFVWLDAIYSPRTQEPK